MIKLPAYFTRFGSRSDGSAGLSFTTQELGSDEFVQLRENLNQFGWLVFQKNDFSVDDLPKEQAEESNKTPSKRIRSVLFILWQQEGRKGDFEVFYRDRMDKLIEMIKSKLDKEPWQK